MRYVLLIVLVVRTTIIVAEDNALEIKLIKVLFSDRASDEKQKVLERHKSPISDKGFTEISGRLTELSSSTARLIAVRLSKEGHQKEVYDILATALQTPDSPKDKITSNFEAAFAVCFEVAPDEPRTYPILLADLVSTLLEKHSRQFEWILSTHPLQCSILATEQPKQFKTAALAAIIRRDSTNEPRLIQFMIDSTIAASLRREDILAIIRPELEPDFTNISRLLNRVLHIADIEKNNSYADWKHWMERQPGEVDVLQRAAVILEEPTENAGEPRQEFALSQFGNECIYGTNTKVALQILSNAAKNPRLSDIIRARSIEQISIASKMGKAPWSILTAWVKETDERIAAKCAYLLEDAIRANNTETEITLVKYANDPNLPLAVRGVCASTIALSPKNADYKILAKQIFDECVRAGDSNGARASARAYQRITGIDILPTFKEPDQKVAPKIPPKPDQPASLTPLKVEFNTSVPIDRRQIIYSRSVLQCKLEYDPAQIVAYCGFAIEEVVLLNGEIVKNANWQDGLSIYEPLYRWNEPQKDGDKVRKVRTLSFSLPTSNKLLSGYSKIAGHINVKNSKSSSAVDLPWAQSIQDKPIGVPEIHTYFTPPDQVKITFSSDIKKWSRIKYFSLVNENGTERRIATIEEGIDNGVSTIKCALPEKGNSKDWHVRAYLFDTLEDLQIPFQVGEVKAPKLDEEQKAKTGNDF